MASFREVARASEGDRPNRRATVLEIEPMNRGQLNAYDGSAGAGWPLDQVALMSVRHCLSEATATDAHRGDYRRAIVAIFGPTLPALDAVALRGCRSSSPKAARSPSP